MPLSSWLCAMLLIAALVSTGWVRLNISPSVPVGLYRLHAVPAVLEPGMFVVLPVPPSVQAVHSAWVPLLKPIAAVPGDMVCNLDTILFVHGTWYGLIHTEVHGIPLPHIEEGCFEVPEGTVFVASHARRSLDSRYFDVVPVAGLTALATPLLTWR